MIEWFTQLATLDKVLCIMALISSALFLVQLVMMLIGGDHGDVDAQVDVAGMDADLDMDVHGDLDMDGQVDASHPEAVHADTDVAFKVVSVQGLMAFFMMLGWVGLAAHRAWGFGAAMSVGLGVGAGVVADLFIAKVFQWFKRMQSSGTMDLRNAVGQEGEIYLSIKGDGVGKVRVAVQGHLKVFDAMSDDKSDLPTGTAVRVVRVVQGNTMVVKKV